MRSIEPVSESDRPYSDLMNIRASTGTLDDPAGRAVIVNSPDHRALAASIATGRAAPRQKRTDLPVCRQSDQMDMGDPLPMPPESVKVDGASVAVDTRGGSDSDS